MAVCSMCRKAKGEMDDYLLENKPICDECAKKLNDLVESEDRKTVREAFNYIYACKEQASDPAIASYLQDVLENNASAIDDFEEKEKQKRKKEPINFEKQADFFAERNEEQQRDNSNPAISTLFAVFAWIIWIGGLIEAIIISTHMPNGFAWFIGIGVAVLVSGSIPMAVSYIIKYLSQIADNTYAIRKQSKK